MDKKYSLDNFKTLNGNSFKAGDIDLIYFSIDKEDKTIREIVDKINLMLVGSIHEYESEYKCDIDINNLETDARVMISLANKEHNPERYISVTISSCDPRYKEILIYKEFIILHGTNIYEVFKEYFMKRLESELFENRVS